MCRKLSFSKYEQVHKKGQQQTEHFHHLFVHLFCMTNHKLCNRECRQFCLIIILFRNKQILYCNTLWIMHYAALIFIKNVLVYSFSVFGLLSFPSVIHSFIHSVLFFLSSGFWWWCPKLIDQTNCRKKKAKNTSTHFLVQGKYF